MTSLNIFLQESQWNGAAVVNHPMKQQLNIRITQLRLAAEEFVLALAQEGMTRLSVKEVKNRFENKQAGIDDSQNARLEFWFLKFMEQKRESTRRVYAHTLSRLRAYCPKLEEVTLDEVNGNWLRSFDRFLEQTSPSRNARNIHLRNIRAVFNAAIDAEATQAYPFRRFKIRPEATRKRSMALDTLRRLFSCEVDEYAEFYRDMFKLMFMLIGINSVDLHGLRCVTDEGRVEYRRAKTHRLYSVKVEPEAMEIIERWRGEKGLVAAADRWDDHRNFRRQMNKALKSIGATRKGLGGKKQDDGWFPELSTYWARHSWATVAASLDVPKDTIAAALGHGGNTVTDIYIDFDQRKVDEANRKVLDWVLYGKRDV